uniref:Uncharacterized protein n=1 Tax=Mycena chlorophos TaxID=658473 RepID=A0ABQ0L5I4_MYCCL|nr:predicted protein [Mycena chlorophos]
MHERLIAQLERDYPNRSRFLDLATVAQEPLLRLLFETIRSDANAVVNLESTTNTPDVALVLNLDDGATAETQGKARQAEAESRLLCQRSAWTCVWQRDCRIAGSRLQTGSSKSFELLLLPLTHARRCAGPSISVQSNVLNGYPRHNLPVDNHEEESQATVSQPPLGHAASCCEGLTPCWLISAMQGVLRGSTSHIPRLAYLGRAPPKLHQTFTHRRRPTEPAFHAPTTQPDNPYNRIGHSHLCFFTHPSVALRGMSSLAHSFELPTWNLCPVATTFSAASSHAPPLCGLSTLWLLLDLKSSGKGASASEKPRYHPYPCSPRSVHESIPRGHSIPGHRRYAPRPHQSGSCDESRVDTGLGIGGGEAPFRCSVGLARDVRAVRAMLATTSKLLDDTSLLPAYASTAGGIAALCEFATRTTVARAIAVLMDKTVATLSLRVGVGVDELPALRCYAHGGPDSDSLFSDGVALLSISTNPHTFDSLAATGSWLKSSRTTTRRRRRQTEASREPESPTSPYPMTRHLQFWDKLAQLRVRAGVFSSSRDKCYGRIARALMRVWVDYGRLAGRVDLVWAGYLGSRHLRTTWSVSRRAMDGVLAHWGPPSRVSTPRQSGAVEIVPGRGRGRSFHTISGETSNTSILYRYAFKFSR